MKKISHTTTEHDMAMTENTELLTPEGFYDSLAPAYDEMTDWTKRYVREKPFFHVLVDKYRIRRALDAGAGTGFHTSLLARLGVEVTAVDVSAEMVTRLQRLATLEQIPMTVLHSSFLDLDPAVVGKFDAVFCMGNVLPHFLSREELREVLQRFSELLKPGGIFFAQMLNYERILSQRPEILNVSDTPAMAVSRSYEYHDDAITFTIRSHHKQSSTPDQILSTTLRPVLHGELLETLNDIGYASVSIFGGISREPFLPEESKDLVVFAVKP